jgi:hypothetical protein
MTLFKPTVFLLQGQDPRGEKDIFKALPIVQSEKVCLGEGGCGSGRERAEVGQSMLTPRGRLWGVVESPANLR